MRNVGVNMEVKFWGVRGSIASPGPQTVRYGGNTTCIEIRAGNELIILDGGTGIFPLSQTLFPELPRKSHIFITHSHWDHIQGLPFLFLSLSLIITSICMGRLTL
jgi:phosphoribosyl 1,2-cyclic phosphodiesterase